MRRRDLLAAFCAMSFARSDFAAANEKRRKIGYLSWFPPTMKIDLDHFREGMRQFGYIEGKDYEIEAYFIDGNRELAQETASKLVQEPVDIIVAVATPAVHVVKEATSIIPIVMYSANALATGLVPSLSHPSSNLTGLSLLMTDLSGKRLAVLHEIRPTLRAVAFLGSANDPQTGTFVRETRTAADRLGMSLSVRLVDGPWAIGQNIFDEIKKDGSEAVIVQPIFTGYQDKIVPLAMKTRLPVVSDYAVFADAGALLTYGHNQVALHRRLGYYVDRILKGAKPADLPVEQPTEFELVINARTAAELGWVIPQSVLIQADRVIE